MTDRNIFYRGDYPAFLARTIDSAEFKLDEYESLVPQIVGALTFVGRLMEAEALYSIRVAALSSSAQAEARFFLGVGYCRHSDYVKARKYLGMNFLSLRAKTTDLDRFFAYQGLAFYRYFCGRFRQALRYGRRSLEASMSANFLYGKSFAYDLVGHCLVQLGEVPLGLEHLSQAVQLADRLGNGGLKRGFQVSLACYKAQFMGHFAEAVEEVSSLVEDGQFSDSYSKAALLLELGRQYTLRGDLEAAKKALDQACLPIHATRHRRYAALLGLRYSVLWSESGQPHQALHLIRSSLGELQPDVDTAIESELRGMQSRLLEELGIEPDSALRDRLNFLTQHTGKALGIRILKRQAVSNQTLFLSSSQDALGDLLDQLSNHPKDSVGAIVDSGYYGLLRRALSIRRNQSGASFNEKLNGVIIYDHGKIRYLKGVPPKLILTLAKQLSSGNAAEISKEDLVTRIWGYSYHPLKHDAILYRAVSRLRDWLEPGWIEATGTGYRLRHGVELKFGSSHPTHQAPKQPAPVARRDPDLNWRQLKILRQIKSREFIDTDHCRKLFKVSEVTARRDLAHLVRLSMIARIGKGRAIKYKATV